jgi:hypothetical protein
MITRVCFIVVVGSSMWSCGLKNQSKAEDKISGTYVKEYSIKITIPETGSEVGMRTIRDTIFIQRTEKGYEVSNSKWKLNDYDKEGWQNMKHSEDRSMPTFQVTFHSVDGSLRSPSMPDLFLDSSKGQLFNSKNRDRPYQKF